MTTSQAYFMEVVKSESISAAAEKLFLSQQNLSNHMHRLEAKYGILFTRKPRFKLTAAGQALYETLCGIDILERGLDNRLLESKELPGESIRFGIHVSRADTVFPYVLQRFRKEFPSTKVELRFQDTELSTQLLERGDLDLFLGVDTIRFPHLEIVHLYDEFIYVVASRQMLQKNRVDVKRRSLPVSVLQNFRFLRNTPTSRLRRNVDHFLNSRHIRLDESVVVSDFRLKLKLASQGEGACFCPGFLLQYIEELNRWLPAKNRLYTFLVEGLSVKNDISIVYHKLAYKSAAMEGFITAFQEEFQSLREKGVIT